MNLYIKQKYPTSCQEYELYHDNTPSSWVANKPYDVENCWRAIWRSKRMDPWIKSGPESPVDNPDIKGVEKQKKNKQNH